MFRLALVGALTIALHAQTPTGSLSGNTTDSTSAAIAGAKIRLINVRTQEINTATSNATGVYLFPIVAAGEYTVEAETSGFKLERRSGLIVEVNQNARVDFVLQVGSVREVVDVKADAPMVDTADVQIGETVDQERIDNLPLAGRNVYDLIGLMPGAVDLSTVVSGSAEGNTMSVNGNRIRDNNFYLDGGNNTSQWRNGGNMSPNPDAVAEFKLLTSNFDAEYGRQPGSVLNVVTRSGTNQFHGSMFEFLRNDTVNADNFFHNKTTPLKWNQFGGTFGGPIFKNKTFFFASYQGLRQRTDAAVNGVPVLDQARRNGDFSGQSAAKRPVDPLTKVAFPGGIIPKTRLDPVMQNFIKEMLPLGNNAAGTNFSDAENAPVTDDQGMLKIDHQVSSNNRVSGTLFLNRSSTEDPFHGSQLPNYSNAVTAYSQNNVVINDSMVVKPNLISETRFSYVLNYNSTVQTILRSWSDWGSKIVLGATPARPPRIVITSSFTAGPSGAGDNLVPQSTWGGSQRFTWIKGNHNVRTGFGYNWNHFREFGNWLGAGQVNFTGSYTGNGEADFLLGMANTFRQNNGLNRNFSEGSYSAFVQDNWKVARRLTLELGLRWELNPPYTAADGALGAFQWGVQSKMFPTAPRGMLFPGDPGIPDGVAPTIYTNFSPRVGFAWDLFGDGRTAVRGGYGVFYGVGMVNLVSNLQSQPFIADITLNGTDNMIDPWAKYGGTPYPYKVDPKNPIFVTPVTQNYIGENSGSPYTQQFNFMIQRQLTGVMSLQVGYVGNIGRKLYIQRDANAPIYGPGATANNVAARRPYMPESFGAIYENMTGSNSNYNSLQVSFNRRMSHRFSVMANYVWSRSMAINDIQATGISSVTVSDNNDFRRDYGPTGFNYPQVFKMSWIYQSPQIRLLGFVGKQILSGWQLNGISTARTGKSLNVTSGTDTNVDGMTNDRPDVVGDWRLAGGRSRGEQLAKFFNTAAFAKPAAGVLYGNAGRNVLVGPNAVSFNVSASKDYRIGEGQKRLQFRTDFFNIFNEVNLGNPNTALNNANFGKITSAAAPRQLQFCLRLYF